MTRQESGAVLIVGGRGFVGSHVVRACVRAGYDVHVFGPGMDEDRLLDLKGRVTVHEGSLEDTASIQDALRSSGEGSILSLAAYSHGTDGLMRAGEAQAERALSVNVLGFRNLLEAARAHRIRRVVWASSTVVYGPAGLYPQERVDEDAPRRPHTFYGLTKVLAEDLARYYRERFGLEVCALRLPLVFGPGLWYRGAAEALLRLFAAAAPGAKVEVRGQEAPFDLMYVRDVADAFVAAHAFSGALAERYNVNGFTTTYREIIAAVNELVPDCRITFIPEPPPFVFPLIEARRIVRDLGFWARFDLRAAAEDYLRALRSERPA